MYGKFLYFWSKSKPYPTTKPSGISVPMYFTSTFSLRSSTGLSSKVTISIEATFLYSKNLIIEFSVVPVSTISSTIKRSEEHTSELQSRFELVCRLLLEKKKAHSHLQLKRDLSTSNGRGSDEQKKE